MRAGVRSTRATAPIRSSSPPRASSSSGTQRTRGAWATLTSERSRPSAWGSGRELRPVPLPTPTPPDAPTRTAGAERTTMNTQIPARYRRLLLTYSRAWRREHETVVLGTLLEADEAAGRSGPSRRDRMGFLLGGMLA